MTNIVFLRDLHYMKKVREVHGSQTKYQQLAFFDHNHEELSRIIHAFPVVKKSVGCFINRYRPLGEWDQREFRFKQVLPPEGWRTYALSWQEMNNFVCGNCIVPPQVVRFQGDLHSNKEGEEHFQMVCGCCSCTEWGVPLEYQVVFSPCPIAYTRKATTT